MTPGHARLNRTALTKLFGTTAFRLSLATIAAFILAASLVVGYIIPQARDLLTRSVLQTISAEVKGLREQYEAGGLARLSATLAQRAATPGSSLYYLADANGRKLAGNLSRKPPEIGPDSAGGVFHYAGRGDGDVQKRLAAGVMIAVPGGALLVVGRDIEDQRRFAYGVKRAALWGFALLLVIGLGGGLAVSRHVLKRIDAVTDASARIMAGDMAGRIALSGSGDELDRLSENLNAMLERIEQLMAGLREVSDNIAHDLKTPLNRLRNRAEAALGDPGGTSAYRDALEGIIEEADGLMKTFNALLSIARLEAGSVTDNLEPVQLGAIVRDVAELYEPAAEEAGFRINVDVSDDIVIKANRQLIGQALANLIDNAIKYSAVASVAGAEATAGDIDVLLRRVAGGAEIVIGDRGQGIAAQDRERVLQRFVRLEASRSRPGSGLGLSLVSAVARLHAGSIRLEDNEPGLRVVITLPLSSKGMAELERSPQVSPGPMVPASVRRSRDAIR